MSDAIIASALGVLGTLLGVCIGWFLNRSTVNHTVRQQEFYKAAAAFRTAFADEYRILRGIVHQEGIEDTFVQTTLSNAASKHENAFYLFRPYLTGKKKQEFDHAWKDYLCPEGGNIETLPSPFIDYIQETRPDIAIKLAIDKLEALMAFAKPV